jgi:hypothetical protein
MRLLACAFLALVLAYPLATDCNGKSPAKSQAARWSYQKISDSLLKCLSVDLDRRSDDFSPETPPIYSSVEYVEAISASESFRSRYHCTIEKSGPDWFSISLGLTSAVPDYPEPLPQFYVFLPSNGQRRATFASFLSFSDPSLVRLPGELNDLTKRRIQALVREWKDIGQWEESHLEIEADSLFLRLPKVSTSEFILMSPTSVKKTRLKRVEIAVREWGCYQVYGEFVDTLSGAIIAYPMEDNVAPPKFIDFDSSKSIPGFNTEDYMVSLTIPGQNQVYSGSRYLVTTSVDLLWNYLDSTITKLECSFGINMGNEHPHFTQLYLLFYDHRYFVLRLDPQLAKLIRIDEQDFSVSTIADETAPDL